MNQIVNYLFVYRFKKGEGGTEQQKFHDIKIKRAQKKGMSFTKIFQHPHANSVFCLSPPTVRLNEHRPAAPESLGVAGAVLPDFAIASRILLREAVRILTFELGERLLVAVLRALLALMLGDGVRRIEAEPLLVVSLGRHSVLLRAPGRPSEVEGTGFNVHAQPATQTIMTH